jgi:hypothetical protein
MNFEALLFVAAGIVLVGAWAVFQARRKRKRFTAVPLVMLGSAGEPDGRVIRLTGTVRAVEPLVSGPYTGRECVVVIAERWDVGSRFQRRIDRVVRETTFSIDDATGVARVIVGRIDYVDDLVPVQVATSGPDRVFGAGVIASSLDSRSGEQVREYVIQPGDRVTCLGVLRRGADGEFELEATAVTTALS